MNSGVYPQNSQPFQGLSNPTDVQNALNNGTLSVSDALTILQGMQASNPQGIPAVSLSSGNAVSSSGASSQPPQSFGSLYNSALGGELNALGLVSPGAATVAKVASGNSTSPANPASSWIQTNLANYGLVVMGAILVLGALLISQKETVLKVSQAVKVSKAAKAAKAAKTAKAALEG